MHALLWYLVRGTHWHTVCPLAPEWTPVLTCAFAPVPGVVSILLLPTQKPHSAVQMCRVRPSPAGVSGQWNLFPGRPLRDHSETVMRTFLGAYHVAPNWSHVFPCLVLWAPGGQLTWLHMSLWAVTGIHTWRDKVAAPLPREPALLGSFAGDPCPVVRGADPRKTTLWRGRSLEAEVSREWETLKRGDSEEGRGA